jgi:propanol-preferring alcohol dehydrogenase
VAGDRRGVCRTDLHLAEGDLAPHRSRTVPGHDVVGVVDALAPDAARFAMGDRIGIAWLRGTCRIAGDAGRAGRTCVRTRYSPDGTPTAATRSMRSSRRPALTGCPKRWTTSRPRRCSVRALSGTARCAGRSCRRAAGWASTGSGRRHTSSPKSRSRKAPRSTCSPAAQARDLALELGVASARPRTGRRSRSTPPCCSRRPAASCRWRCGRWTRAARWPWPASTRSPPLRRAGAELRGGVAPQV